jgi:hypothetical protein
MSDRAIVKAAVGRLILHPAETLSAKCARRYHDAADLELLRQ